MLQLVLTIPHPQVGEFAELVGSPGGEGGEL